MKKYAFAALTIACCTAFSSIGYAASGFADINNIPWATTYINSVADKGLMVGDYNKAGKKVFRGNDNMTYTEAAQLIYTIVKSTGFSDDITETGIQKYTMEMNSEGVPAWGQKAVAFCREKGIITSYNLTKFTTNGKSNNITREDMAVFFGKALAVVYPVSSGTSLSFSDTASISAEAKPYVELLNVKGIVSGDNNNKFNPSANITRAEVAVLASKTYNLMKKGVPTNSESGYTQTTGVVASIAETNGTWLLRILTANGTEGFVLDNSTPVYINSTNNVGPKGIGLGDTVQVSHYNAEIAKVTITKDAVVDANIVNRQDYGKTITDKGEFISAGNYSIKILDKSNREVSYVIATDAKITLDGKTATMRQLSDMSRKKSTAYVVLEISSTTNEATKVEVTEKEASTKNEGKITALNRKKISILSGSKTYTYDFADDVTYKLNGNNVSSQADFMEKYDDLDDDNKYITAKLTFNKDDEVTKVDGTASNYKDEKKDYKGTISSFNGNTIKISGTSKKFDIASNAKYDITVGATDIDDNDLFGGMDGDEALETLLNSDAEVYVELTVKNSEVTRISGYVSRAEGTLTSMTVSNASRLRGSFWLDMKGIGDVEFKFDSDTRISIDGTTYDEENIESLKKSINKNEVEDVTVKFDADGVAESVKD